MRRTVFWVVGVLALVLLVPPVAAAASFTINGGEEYTNSRAVVIEYSPNYGDKYFRVSDRSYMGSSVLWHLIAYPRSFDWLLSAEQGEQTVYMEFAEDPGKKPYGQSRRSI